LVGNGVEVLLLLLLLRLVRRMRVAIKGKRLRVVGRRAMVHQHR